MAGQTETVNTKCGPVVGLKRKTIFGDDFYSFRGIPYAKPPVGDLRFKDPQPAEPWTEPFDGTHEGPNAISMDVFVGNAPGNVAPNSSEDCLRINVYTKELEPRKPLPVMVWIHGGAFKMGSSNEMMYGADYLLQKNIVFVSFNYRLGALGFMSINDPAVNVPGNAALKDQTLALRWVRENVQYFGGDNRNVTIFGVSAGGCSVHFHLLSDWSKGLFDKAISQSGTALANWANFPNNNWAARLATKLGWDEDGGDEGLYEFLKDADAADIIKAQDTIRNPEEIKNRINTFTPAMEPYVAEQSFFAQPPSELAETAWSVDVPVIIGGVADEGLLFYLLAKSQASEFQNIEAFERFVPMDLPAGSDESLAIAKRIKEYYYQDEEANETNFDKAIQIWGDGSFWHGIHLSVIARLNSANAKTYLYRFDFDSKLFIYLKMVLCGGYVKGTCHGDDIQYLFKGMFIKDVVLNSAEHKTISRMVDMWTQFALTGNPNGEELKTVAWHPVSNATPPFKCLNISDNLGFIDLPESKRMAFWDSLLELSN